MVKNIVLLLTACVNPNGMTNTVLQNVEERRRQYVDALSYYLKKTSCKIVFVENTCTDITDGFQDYIHAGRLEYLTFDGNNYDKKRGKSYGEALQMLYALDHSVLFKQSHYIVKITGRVKVFNINEILSSRFLKFSNVFRSDLRDGWISTLVFVSTPFFLKTFITRHIEEMTDEIAHHTIEYVLQRAIIDDDFIRSEKIIPFLRPPQVEGICATEGREYLTAPCKTNIKDNLFFLSVLYKKRGNRFMSQIIKVSYYCSLILLRQRFI